MRRIALGLVFVLSGIARLTTAEPLGTLTVNGVAKEIKGAVMIFDAENRELRVFLLPSSPTEKTVANLRSDRFPELTENYYGQMTLAWATDREWAGTGETSILYLLGCGIQIPGKGSCDIEAQVNQARLGQYETHLSRPPKAGGEVTLTAKGSCDAKTGECGMEKGTIAWDIKVTGKVLSPAP